jgi:hypothetical protein
VLWIVNGEIVKVTDENVQKDIDINTEVLWIINGASVTFNISPLTIPNTSVLIYISF